DSPWSTWQIVGRVSSFSRCIDKFVVNLQFLPRLRTNDALVRRVRPISLRTAQHPQRPAAIVEGIFQSSMTRPGAPRATVRDGRCDESDRGTVMRLPAGQLAWQRGLLATVLFRETGRKAARGASDRWEPANPV